MTRLYLLIGALVFILFTHFAAYQAGVRSEKQAAELAETKKANVVIQSNADKGKKADSASAVVVTNYVYNTEYVDRVKTVYVDKIITVKDDSACTINTGFVRIHDGAVDVVPVEPSASDSTPSGVPLSGVAQTVVDNYASCNKTAEQLRSLQEWVRKQEQIWNEKK